MVENNQSNQNTKPITPNPTPFPHEPFLKRGIQQHDTHAHYMPLLPLQSHASSSSSKRTRLYNFDDNSYHPNFDPKGKKPITDDNNIIIISDTDSDDGGDEKQKKEITENQIPLALDTNAYNIDSESDDTNDDTDDDDDDDDDDDYSTDDETPRNKYKIQINQYEYEEWRRLWHNRMYRDSAKRYVPRLNIPFEAKITYVPRTKYENCGSPTPFSEAMEVIQKRVLKCKLDDCFDELPKWFPKRNYGEELVLERSSVPSLQELSLNILAKHADAIVSLDGVSDELQQKLCKLVCDYRKMKGHFLELFLREFPTEVRIKDCSWMTEEEFTKYFGRLDPSILEVIQLDQCGRIITDDTLLVTLARSPNSLARLISLSLSGACRLTDKGLQSLVSSATALRSLNLSQCSLLTFPSLNILADSLGSLLKELYLDDCILIDATKILSALKRLEQLEVLSLAGVSTVSDEFIKDYIIACGHNIKELVLMDCVNLTDASMKVIAEHCPGLHALNLMNLNKLTDLSLEYLANFSQALRTLKLRRNPFSDEAVAAFLEICGKSLEELSLNSIKKVGLQTTLSLEDLAKNLHTLDLSWCRNLTDNELGFIVDNCLSLRLLKLFGCSQITDAFLKGHSNSKVQIIGLRLSPLLQHMEGPNPRQGVLRYSSVSQ